MQEGKNGIAIIPIVVAVAIIGGIFIGSLIERNRHRIVAMSGQEQVMTPIRGRSAGNTKLSSALMLVNKYYVDAVPLDSLIEKIMPEILKELDPHSVYIPAQDLAEASEPLEGEFDGIGIVFNMATDTILVQNVISGGPSDRAGLWAGDRIIMIDDSLVAGQKIDQKKIIKMLRGRRGTTVVLDIQRPGVDDLVRFTVERGIIPIRSVETAFMLKPGIGYLKLSTFSRNSYGEVMSALQHLKYSGADRIIFDLRGNSGGFMEVADAIANQFLDADQLIVYTEDRNRERDMKYSDGQGQFRDMNIIVLVDEGSASASEILAGAIQDNDRGLVIGRRTYGKGLVQRQFDFNDGSAIRLTVARYYTPTGRSIQKPYTPGDGESYAIELWERYKHQELFTVDSIKFADSLKFHTPGGRTVYGGGGIMPDIFVPVDTTGVTHYLREVMGRNILYRYTIEYSDKHREQLNNITTLGQLYEFMDSDTRMFQDFVNYAARHGVPPNRAQTKESRELITAYLRAYIGRNSRLEETGYYANIYVIDNVMLRAIEEARKMGPGVFHRQDVGNTP